MARRRSFAVIGAALGVTLTALAAAEPMSAVAAGMVRSRPVGALAGVQAGLAAAAPTTSRLAGADRVGTAVEISKHAFPQPFASGGSVYLARKDVFADAVAAGSLTDGPVLLVPTCGAVPQVVMDEVSRLTPARVVALGGVAAVCEQVLYDVAGSRAKARLAGSDRFMTALEIARERAKQGPITEIYVAYPWESPDAVAGGQLTRGPVLLDSGIYMNLYAQFISTIEPRPLRVVGLGGLVSNDLLDFLNGTNIHPKFAGADRHETAAAVAMRQFPEDADTVYLARSDVFADAVASGALTDGPVLLVRQCSLPTAARERIAAARPLKIIALGGTGAVCDDVLVKATLATSRNGGRSSGPYRADDGWSYSGGPETLAMSANGRWLVLLGRGFWPDPSELSLVVKDLSTGVVDVVAGTGKPVKVGYDTTADISADGRFLVFDTSVDSDVNDWNHSLDVLLQDRSTGLTRLVSVTPTGLTGNAGSSKPAISDDGSTVVFTSAASDLIAGDENGFPDIFAANLASGQITAVSVTSGGLLGNGPSEGGSDVSGDGRFVVFTTVASNLLTGDTEGTNDIVRTEIATGTSMRVNRLAGAAIPLKSARPTISGNGQFVSYGWYGDEVSGIWSEGENVFVRDMASGARTLVSFAEGSAATSRTGYAPMISADGNYIAFLTTAQLSPRDDYGGQVSVYLYDRRAALSVWVSAPFADGAKSGLAVEVTSTPPQVSGDGSKVVYYANIPSVISYDYLGADVLLWERLAPR